VETTGQRPPLLIFGGTFDPPHYAHVMLPPIVAHRLGGSEVLYVPAAINPLKREAPTPAEHRLAMLRLALDDAPATSICTFELEHPGPSYTVETLDHLRRKHGPDVPFRLLMGVDAALDFPRWREPDRVLALAMPAVMIRPPWNGATWRQALRERYADEQARRWLSWTVPVPRMDISASDVRRRVATQRELADLVSPAVVEYIRRHDLYRPRPGQWPPLPGMKDLAEDARARVPEVSTEDLRTLLRTDGQSLLLIDVREAQEWAAGHIEGAVHLSRGVLERDLEATCFGGAARIEDLRRPIVCYSGTGQRSLLAARTLREMGFDNVRALRGGLHAWQGSGAEHRRP
jgi:nicotinate-nucleotide adenylyltransferase